MPVRAAFHRDLERLDQDIVRMGALVEGAIERATLALAEHDLELAKKVMAEDDNIDALFVDIETRALALLAQQQPVARDLRLVVTILLCANDLERSGDLAFNIARLVHEHMGAALLRPVQSVIYELGSASARLMSRAIDAWAAKDLELAAELRVMDDKIDALYGRLFQELFALGGEVSLDVAVNIALVGRWFERIADHAVNMAERLTYFITGDESHLG